MSLRDGGDDGVHTYRIPGLASSLEGTLVGENQLGFIYESSQAQLVDVQEFMGGCRNKF